MGTPRCIGTGKMGRVNVRKLQHEVSGCKMKPKDVKHAIMKKYPWEKVIYK